MRDAFLTELCRDWYQKTIRLDYLEKWPMN